MLKETIILIGLCCLSSTARIHAQQEASPFHTVGETQKKRLRSRRFFFCGGKARPRLPLKMQLKLPRKRVRGFEAAGLHDWNIPQNRKLQSFSRLRATAPFAQGSQRNTAGSADLRETEKMNCRRGRHDLPQGGMIWLRRELNCAFMRRKAQFIHHLHILS